MNRLLILLALPLAAQAAPPSDPRALTLIPRYELAAAPVLKARRAVDDKRGQPVQFAVGMPTDLRLSEGRWDDRDAHTARWRLRLRSADALSLNLQLADVQLPPGAKLWLYDVQGNVVQGPYTQKDISRNGRLWTAVAPGEEAILELHVAKDEVSATRLRIVEINHGFLPVLPTLTSGKSGGCNVDAVCPEGDDWRDEIRSVARITINGQFLCSGQLINNARQDPTTPYFITADHCRVGEAATPADSVVFYWNYLTSACGGTPDGDLGQNQSGSTFIADDSRADFTLLRLNQPPISGTYFAGWNVGASAPQSGASIHHPNGDEKRISLYNTPATASDVLVDGVAVSAWEVRWARGVTERGSSGGGLWDQNHLLVGVLSGGDSSCENPSGADYFGRLNVGWTASPDPAGQLKAHLDPDNTGTTTLAGRDPAVPHTAALQSGSGVLLGGGALDGLTLLSLVLISGFNFLRGRPRRPQL